jgi:membrane-associated phospholipid phosphatase
MELLENHGPIIIILISLYQLFNKQNYLFFYIIGTGFNTILNLFLKYIIKQPRPSNNYSKLFDIAHKNGYFYSIDKYGMPSGHAQNLGFSCGFMYMFIKNNYLLWIYILISCITLFLRFYSKKHSIFQLFIGYLIGVMIGIIFYYLANHYTKGIINKKKDDYTFIF